MAIKIVSIQSLSGRRGKFTFGTICFNILIIALFSIANLNKVNAQVSTLTAWTNVYNNNSTTAQTSTFSIPAGTGTNRLLVVAIASSTSPVGARSVASLTYGTKALTAVTAGDMSSTAIQAHTGLYYLKESDIQLATNTTLSFTVTGTGTKVTTVWYSVYDFVNQTTVITDSKNYNNGTTAGSSFVFGTALNVNANNQAVMVASSYRVGNTNARTISAYPTNWTSSNEQTFAATDGIRNVVANRSIPAVNTTDLCSGTISNSTLFSMTAMSINGCTQPTASAGSALSAICKGGTSAALGGSTGGSATGGTWSDGGVGGTFNSGATSISLTTYTPPASFSGSVTLTLTSTGGTCGTVIATKTLTVTAPPASTVSYSGTPFCKSVASAVVALTGTTGGTFASTTGLTINAANGTITPSSSTAGTYTITYTVAASGGCSVYSTTTSVTINALPVLSANGGGSASVCANANTAAFTNAQAGGVWSITSGTGTASTTTGGVVTGLTAGTVTLNYTYTNICTNTVTSSITVNALPTLSAIAGGSATVCVNGNTAAFTNAQTGGTWSIVAGTGTASVTSAGVVTGLTAGTVNVKYTYSNGTCSNSVTSNLTIQAIPTAVIAYASSSYCKSISAPQSITLTGSTGGTYSSTAGLSINSSTGAITPSTSTAGSYVVTYSVTGCSTFSTTTNVSITQDQYIFDYPSLNYCFGNNAIISVLHQTALSGGTYSSAPSGLSIDQNTGAVNLSASLAGNYIITYTYSGGCSSSITTGFNIVALPTITCPANMGTCKTVAAFALTAASPFGGVYTGNGVSLVGSTYYFNPATADTGTHTITYSFTSAGGCTSTCSFTITVTNSTTTVSAIPVSNYVYSGNNVIINLSSSVPGTQYTWTVTSNNSNVSGYSAQPTSVVGPLNQQLFNNSPTIGELTYTITPTLIGCSGSPVTVVISLPSSTFCESPGTFQKGSCIIDMGVVPQTYGNGLKPYGLLYQLLNVSKVPVYWAIRSNKSFENPASKVDETDFTVDARAFKGGAFIIPAAYLSQVQSVINSWVSQGVVVYYTASAFTPPVYELLTRIPNAVLDVRFGSTIQSGFYTASGIPNAAYTLGGVPTNITSCDDVYVLPHSEPSIWTQSYKDSLLNFINNRGWLYSSCKAVSQVENIQGMNFLSSTGLVSDSFHVDGTPPYNYSIGSGLEAASIASDPFSQTIGTLDGATTYGAETIFLPKSTWRSATKIAVYDSTFVNSGTTLLGYNVNTGISYQNTAALVAYGRAFGDQSKGLVMYVAGHDLTHGSVAENVALARLYGNFILRSGIGSRPTIIPVSIPLSANSGQTISLSVSVPTSTSTIDSTWWTSDLNGIFSSQSYTTNFTAPTVAVSTPCTIQFRVKDACGRYGLYCTTILINPTITNNYIGASQTICSGVSAAALIGTVPLIPAGNAFTYQWLMSTTSSSTGFIAATGINNLQNYNPGALTQTTWFRRQIVSSLFTVFSTSVEVTVIPGASITTQPSTLSQYGCAGNNLSIDTLRIVSSNPSVTYQWYYNATAINSAGTLISGATTANVAPLTALSGTLYYYCTITNASGCSTTSNVSGSINIGGGAAITSNVSRVRQSACVGGSFNQLSVTLSNNVGLTYQWYSNIDSSSGINRVLIPGATSSTFTPPATSVGSLYYYCKIIYSSATCPSVFYSISGLTTVKATPTVGITNNTASVLLTCAVPSISLTATTDGISYSWNNSLGSTASVAITTPGTYIVTATGSNGCTKDSSIIISQNITAPTAGITNNSSTTILTCTTASINVTATGGVGYSWNNSLGTNATAIITTPGSYVVTVTGTNGCTSTSSITTTQNTTPPTAAITNNTATTVLTCTTASINVTATGGISYSWNNGLGNNAIANITNPGTYIVTATGSNGCTSTSTITATQNITPPVSSIINNSANTVLTCTTTSINVTATGGISYLWNNSLGAVAAATITLPGTYSVTATGTNGCTSTSTITTTQNIISPTAGITNNSGSNSITCNVPLINLTATGDGTYLWSGGLGTASNVNITTPGNYNVTVTGTNGCVSTSSINILYTQSGSRWTGVHDNYWDEEDNWCGGVPTDTSSVTIPAGTPNNPVISVLIGKVKNITLEPGAILYLDNQTLKISGTVTSNGNINAVNGNIELAGISTQQSISGSMFAAHRIKNLKISNSAGVIFSGINDTIKLTESLAFGTSNSTLNANGNLTIVSDINGTARVADLTANGTLSGNKIIGNVTVERYIPNHAKAWQLLSTPTLGQTVKAAWQEGNSPLLNTNNAGYGTIITSNNGGSTAGATGLGFDIYTAAGPTMKLYSSLDSSWFGIPNTSISIANNKGYMILIRGDRSVTAYNQSATATTMRTSGLLYQPIGNAPSTVSVAANRFESVGNPYASAIDVSKLQRTGGVQDVYYVWDPKLTTGPSSVYGLGGYRTIVRSGAGYTVVPAGGSYANGNVNIESGQAFLIRSNTISGTLNFNETTKTSGGSMVTRVDENIVKLSAELSVISAGNTILLDGTLNQFDADYSNDVDDADAVKLLNGNTESISIAHGTKKLVAEQRGNVLISDTIFYNIGSLRRLSYQLNFETANFISTGLTARLIDKYMATSTLLNSEGNSMIPFTVNTDAGSYASDRFYVVLDNLSALPVSIKYVSANRNSDVSATVNWKVDNETSIEKYEVERSANGRSFEAIASALPKVNNGGSAEYNYFDRSASKAINFYRIKAVSIGGMIQYSNIVKIAAVAAMPSMTVFPNPVVDKIAYLNFSDVESGSYQVKIYNQIGQQVFNKKIIINAGTEIVSLSLNKSISTGNYKLVAFAPNGTAFTQQILIK